MSNLSRNYAVVNRDKAMLAPFFRDKFNAAVSAANEAGYPIALFEGARTPERQDWLYAQGRTRPGKIVTDKKAWESMHQYGLAGDTAYLINGAWSWNADFDKVSMYFLEQGLEWLAPFERVHFQEKIKFTMQECHEITVQFGLEHLWMLINQTV